MRSISFLSSILLSVSLSAQSFTPIHNGVKALVDGKTIEVSFYNPGAVRVVKYPSGNRFEKKSLSVIASPEDDVDTRMSHNGSRISVSSRDITVDINRKNGVVSFRGPKGKKLLTEGNYTSFMPVDDAGVPSYRVRQPFLLDKDEAVYGLGNLEKGSLSMRGHQHNLIPGNIEDGIPVMQSVKGYSIIWDNYSPTYFSDTDTETVFESEIGDGVDYYFLYGDGSIDGAVRQIRNLTGDVPMFPLWTYGFWQSRERYKSQDEITGVVKRYRELGVPLDGIIQDWQYWGSNYLWNAMEFLTPGFSNPQAMMDTIHAANAHAIISIWSSFGPQTKQYKELGEKGLLFDITTWPMSGIAEIWPSRMDYPSGVKVYDAYSEEARDIYWKYLKGIYDIGMDGWWMDSTEPDHYGVKEEDMTRMTGLGSFRRVRGAYPLMTVGGVYDHQRATSDKQRVFILTRSGWTGQQRYGCNVWTGDVASTWQMLRNQIPAMLNFSMTGNPNVNSDLGGFFCSAYDIAGVDNGPAKNPQFKELYVRWLQMGTFLPMMRSHGADVRREIYEFGSKGEPVYDAIEEAIRLRYALLPYIYSTSWNVTSRGESMIRPLVADFPHDKDTWNRGDQFLLGKALMAAPVLEAQYTPEHISSIDENSGWDRAEKASVMSVENDVDFMSASTAEVFFPKGADWYNFFTGKKYSGGATLTVDTDIKTIPLYVREGSIIPLGPDVQYATEKPWDNLEVRVYAGDDGEFTLYEDEFDNYNYEKGMYSLIKFHWDDSLHKLTISEREGEYPGMIHKRNFRIRLFDNGTEVPEEKVVTYDGKTSVIRL